MNINVYEQKSKRENDIRDLKLNLYKKLFELSEIKNVIRKNCNHTLRERVSIMGYSSINEKICVKCDESVNEYVNESVNYNEVELA